MLATAFILGLLGSTHCIGMCGPIALALPNLSPSVRRSMLFSSLIYNLGRILCYGLLGIIFGLIGQSLTISGFQKWFTLLIGVLLLLTALFSIRMEDHLVKLPVIRSFYTRLQMGIQKQFRKSSLSSFFLIGFLNGLLPCGMVYLAVAGTLTIGSFWYSVGFMIFFGLGTLPLMFTLSVSRHFVPVKVKQKLRQMAPLIMMGFAILLILRALNTPLPIEISFWEAVKNPVLCH